MLGRREQMPPEIETPEVCHGYGAIVAEPYIPGQKIVFTRFGCHAIKEGQSSEIYSTGDPVDTKDITETYLLQVKRLSEAAIGALCLNCPMCPLNRAPDDLSELDRPRQEG